MWIIRLHKMTRTTRSTKFLCQLVSLFVSIYVYLYRDTGWQSLPPCVSMYLYIEICCISVYAYKVEILPPYIFMYVYLCI